MGLFQFVIIFAVILFLLVHLTAYAIRWVEEGKQAQDERSLFDAPLTAAVDIALELLSSAAVLLLSVVDLILSLRNYPWARRKPATSPPEKEAISRPPSSSPADRPIVFVHGAGMRGLAMTPLARKLRAEGRVTFLFTYWPPGQPFAAYARQLYDHLEGIRRESGYDEFDAIGHSAGGLILRRFITVHNRPVRIRRIVTIGTPHSGSELWRFAPAALGFQLRPGGAFLAHLDEVGLPPEVEATAISGDFDQLIIPNANARWNVPGAVNHTIRNAGHARLIFHRETLRIVREALS